MASSIRDFTSLTRAESAPSFRESLSVDQAARSPTPRDPPSRDHRGSTGSALTHVASRSLRHRSIGRSNTIKTYHEPEHPSLQAGAEPGIDPNAEDEKDPPHLTQLRADCDIRIIDFAATGRPIQIHVSNADLKAALDVPRPADLPCRWISVNGLSWDVIKPLGKKYNLHQLAIEDLIHTRSRTKVDWYTDHAFVVLTLQKLVRLHRHHGSDEDCDCSPGVNDDVDEDVEEKSVPNSRRSWRDLWKKKPATALPRYLDQNMDGKIDEFVQAHTGLSSTSPIKPIRTLHRYESVQIPEHTAFMERHSALADENLAVSVEQVAIFLLADNTVLSFFEHSADDIETPIYDRLASEETMLRRSCDASLLLQAIIDAIVDLAVEVKDAYNKSRKELQIDAMTNPDIKTSRALHIFGEEIDMLQNLFKPIVHLVNALRDHNDPAAAKHPSNAFSDPSRDWDDKSADTLHQHGHKDSNHDRKSSGEPKYTRSTPDLKRVTLKRNQAATSVSITPLAHTYFGDVLDHCITMIQTLEQMDASAANISTLIFNTVGAKTNNFMMILAVVTVFFAPLTFISGYFGMNFASGDGLAHPFSFFWVVAIPCLIAFMLIVFATMLWEQIEMFLKKRGIRAHRRSRRRPPL
nr:cobalt/magnesium transport protein cora [Quercus suber]